MIHASLLATIAIGSFPTGLEAPTPMEIAAELAPVVSGISHHTARPSLFATAIDPHANLLQDGGDQDTTDCILSGATEVIEFPGTNEDELSMETETITCADNTTRRRIKWTITTTQMVEIFTYHLKYSPSGAHDCEPDITYSVDPRILLVQSYYQYPDGYCTGDGDECCVPISSTTVRGYWPPPDGDMDDFCEIPGFEFEAPVNCPNGEVGIGTYMEEPIYHCWDLIKTTTYLRVGDCDENELCKDKRSHVGWYSFYAGTHMTLLSTDCDN